MSGSSSRSSAIRCSALRPRRPNASRSPRTSRTDLSGSTRPSALPAAGRPAASTRPGVAGQVPGRRRSRAVPVSYSSLDLGRGDVKLGHAGPAGVGGQLGPVLLRRSGRCEAAFTRSGRSLLTRTTSSPSAARLRATDRIRVSLSPSRKPGGSTWGSAWFSSTRTVPPRSPTGRSASRRPCAIRRSSRCRSAWRAKKPSSGWWRLASSSVMTTTGRTTRCSANRPMAAGSASSTLVSRT